MLRLFCDSCTAEVPLGQMLEPLTSEPSAVPDVLEILQNLAADLAKAEGVIEVDEDLLSAIGIAVEVIKLTGRFFCSHCLKRYEEHGKFLPERLYC